MTQVVQAACPGCKAVLRIPSDWVSQPIRCKNCGTVMQAKLPAPSTPLATPPARPARDSNKTPPPPKVTSGKAAPAKKSERKRFKTPPPLPSSVPEKASARTAQAAAPFAVQPAPLPSPASPPVAQPVVSQNFASANSFDFDAGHTEDTPRASRRRRGKKGAKGGLVFLAIVLGIVTSASTVAIAFWPKIKPMIVQVAKSNLNGATDDDEDDPPAKSSPSKGSGSKSSTSAKSAPESKNNSKTSAKGPSSSEKARSRTRPEPGEEGAKPKPVPMSGSYPRRAFIISVHNYLYLNPIVDGAPRTMNLKWLKDNSLSNNLHIPLNQIIRLSDQHENPRERRPPLKAVIEKGLENFLKTTRKQDRIMVFFIGHTKEIDNEAYLVPLEGEVDDVKTLIPLKWVYDQLARCEARQKIFVLDGNRYNAAQGEERPVSGPMGPKFEAMLKTPPSGVQVWSACSSGQQSLQFEDAPLGLFLDSFREALSPKKGKGALEGKLHDRDELIPLKEINDAVTQKMQDELERRKLDKTQPQKPLISGFAPLSGAEYDRTEVAAAQPAIPFVNPAGQSMVKKILDDISLPSLKGGTGSGLDIDFTQLPAFSPDVLKAYDGDLKADSKLRLAIHNARVALWAISTATPPRELEAEVKQVRGKLGVDLQIMQDHYTKPSVSGEKVFKNKVFEDSKAMSRIVAQLEDVLERLKDAGAEKDAAPKRWQANYTYLLARFQAQLAYLEDYQSLLGSMRKEYPPHDEKIHSAWRMAAKEKASDNMGKKYDKAARKLYADVVKAYKGTPWEVLAKREKLTALGLEWVAY